MHIFCLLEVLAGIVFLLDNGVTLQQSCHVVIAFNTQIIFKYSLANTGSPECLSFWVHMNGVSMGTLNVIVKQQQGQEKVVFTSDGFKHNFWVYYSATVETSTPWTVVLEGKLYCVASSLRESRVEGDVCCKTLSYVRVHWLIYLLLHLSVAEALLIWKSNIIQRFYLLKLCS